MRVNGRCFFLWSPRMLRRGAYIYFGVKSKSYASRLVDNLYDFYIEGASNLRLLYFRFYRKEYASFQEFLAKRYNLYPNEVKRLKSWRACVKELVYEPNLYLDQFVQDDSMANLLKKYLGEDENEN